MDELLKVENLSLSFDGIQAIKNLSLSVSKDSFTGLMGSNGAGKTSLLNCLSRVYDPTDGEISFDGCDLLSLRSDQIVQLGISRTFQDLNFFSIIPDMMIIDYIRLGRFASARNSLFADGFNFKSSRSQELESKRRARRILEFFRDLREAMEPSQETRGYPVLYGKQGFADLIDVEYESIGSLSFAWRRRLDLARALVSQPRLLLLDEPAQGLPPSEIRNLSEIFKKIRSEFGVSAVVVEHNMSFLMEITDKILVMDAGIKLAEGTPQEIRSNPKVIEIYLGKAEGQEGKIGSSDKTPNLKSSEPVLIATDLDVYYGRAQALFSVSITLFPNQIVSVLGTNGSGKSTLLKAISGVEKPAYGEISVFGEYLPLGWPEFAAERSIQYVPQGHLVFPDMTVFENLKVAGYLPSKKKKYNLKNQIERVLLFFPQLRDMFKVTATNLSGGQQQMLAIGQALMSEPRILLLDEPSLGLAPAYVDAIFDIIQKISKEEGCSILLVEQNVAKALEVSDYVYILNAGILTGKGPSQQFIDDPTIISKRLGFF